MRDFQTGVRDARHRGDAVPRGAARGHRGQRAEPGPDPGPAAAPRYAGGVGDAQLLAVRALPARTATVVGGADRTGGRTAAAARRTHRTARPAPATRPLAATGRRPPRISPGSGRTTTTSPPSSPRSTPAGTTA
ncbi:hypothetical protein ACRAWF_14635 [Streptomyces sp. L7]